MRVFNAPSSSPTKQQLACRILKYNETDYNEDEAKEEPMRDVKRSVPWLQLVVRGMFTMALAALLLVGLQSASRPAPGQHRPNFGDPCRGDSIHRISNCARTWEALLTVAALPAPAGEQAGFAAQLRRRRSLSRLSSRPGGHLSSHGPLSHLEACRAGIGSTPGSVRGPTSL